MWREARHEWRRLALVLRAGVRRPLPLQVTPPDLPACPVPGCTATPCDHMDKRELVYRPPHTPRLTPKAVRVVKAEKPKKP